MDKKLFVTDLDGTLFKDDKTISNCDLKILKRLKKRGVYTAIATGRSSYSFEKAFGLLGMLEGDNTPAVDYIIFSTGAGIMEFETGNLLLANELSPEKIRPVTQFFNELKFDYMVHQAIPDTRSFFYKSHGGANPDFDSRLALYPDYASVLTDDHNFIQPATEVLAIVPPGRIDSDKIGRIKEELAAYSVIQATSPLDHSSTWIEVFCSGVSKSQSAKWLAGMLGVKKKHIVAVGNDYNDLDLLETAGESFVVENAPQVLKNSFKVVSSNNDSGVSRAVELSSVLGLPKAF